MIMILSDGGRIVDETKELLELRGERYIIYFPDLLSAGIYGSGNVIVGGSTVGAISSAIAANGVTAVIDVTASPGSELSCSAVRACEKSRIGFIKCVNIKAPDGGRINLSYRGIAEEIDRCEGNALVYASAPVVSCIAEFSAYPQKIYVPIPKSAEFDTEAALGYGVPLMNVIETEHIGGAESVAELAKKLSAGIIICDGTKETADKAAAGKVLNIPVIITHSAGIEYPVIDATARDAVISACTRLKSSQE